MAPLNSALTLTALETFFFCCFSPPPGLPSKPSTLLCRVPVREEQRRFLSEAGARCGRSRPRPHPAPSQSRPKAAPTPTPIPIPIPTDSRPRPQPQLLPAGCGRRVAAPSPRWGRGEHSQPVTGTVVKSPRHFNCQSGLMGYKTSPARRL